MQLTFPHHASTVYLNTVDETGNFGMDRYGQAGIAAEAVDT